MSLLISIGNYYNASKPFAALFDKTVITNEVNQTKEALYTNKNAVILLGGGEDISPSLYNQKVGGWTHATSELSPRDSHEKKIFELALKTKTPIIGICRGAQLICALSGGSLYQHVVNHTGGNHLVRTSTGEEFEVSSVHHQMMNPAQTKHELLAWSKEVLSRVHLIEGDENVEVKVEPEAIYFHNTRGLALQYHPEFMGQTERGVTWAQELVKKYIMKF